MVPLYALHPATKGALLAPLLPDAGVEEPAVETGVGVGLLAGVVVGVAGALVGVAGVVVGAAVAVPPVALI